MGDSTGFATEGALCAKPFIAGARPRISDPDVVRQAASALAQRLRDRYGDLEFPSPETDDDLAGELCAHLDGYELARTLERHHYWSPDSDMVEILDEAYWEMSKAHSAMEADWLKLAGQTPKLEVGATVRYGDHDAEVTRIDEQRGKYTLFIAALGHVRSGVGTNGLIVNWEEVDRP